MEKCEDVFESGFERFHTRQINRTKLNQELKNELKNRRSAVKRYQCHAKSKTSCFLRTVLNIRNWSLLQRHVHLVQTYCKRNFGGKIRPKQNLSSILRLAEADEQHQSALSHSKRRRVRENPARSVLEG